jgi:hypothetical protein
MMNYKFEDFNLTNDIFTNIPLIFKFSFRKNIIEIFNYFENNMINVKLTE